MTRKELTRRGVLRKLGTISFFGATSIGGTLALLGQNERFANNEITAAEFDLQGQWVETYNGEVQASHPPGPDKSSWQSEANKGIPDPSNFISEPSPAIRFRDLEPGYSGTVTMRLLPVGGDARIYLRGAAQSFNENGYGSLEQHAGDKSPDKGNLQNEVRVKLWYDDNCNQTFDRPNNETEIASGTIEEVFGQNGPLRDGLPLDGNRYPGEYDGSPHKLGKLTFNQSTSEFEVDETVGTGTKVPNPATNGKNGSSFLLSNDRNYTSSVVTIETGTQNNEPKVFNYHLTGERTKICRVEVYPLDTEAGSKKVYQYSKGKSSDTGLRPEEGDQKNPTIGSIVFYYCDTTQPEVKCFTKSIPQCISFRWELPEHASERILTDSLEFEFEFFSKLCSSE